MSKNKLTIDFKGFKEAYEKLDRLDSNINKVTEEALQKSKRLVHTQLGQAMSPHNNTFKTVRSLTKDNTVEFSGTTASIHVGFDIERGGLPSIFLMYGTPRHMGANQYGKHGKAVGATAQDINLYNAIYGTSTKNKVRKLQKEIFDKALEEAAK